jgi:hypothetical protein
VWVRTKRRGKRRKGSRRRRTREETRNNMGEGKQERSEGGNGDMKENQIMR